MTLQEVASHKEHTKIKHSLQCSTDGCDAKISFVTGTNGRSDHFRTVRFSEHVESCPLFSSEELDSLERTIYNKTVEGTLDEEGTFSRVMYFFNKINNPRNTTSSGSKKRRKNSTPSEKTGVTVVLGGKDAPSINDIRETGQKAIVRVEPKQLNQITASDAGKIFQLSAPIKEVIKTQNGYVLSLSFGNYKAKLIITEAFLKGSEDIQVENYLNSLTTFLKKNSSYVVRVFAFCMFDQYNGNETVIHANDFSKFFVSVSGNQNKPRKLDSFQALYTRNIWPK